MDLGRRRRDLSDFLRARREALAPEVVGLERGPRRRVNGLRREEVAALAGVGVTWYTWLEQGREVDASRETLERIGRALRFTATDIAYVLALGGVVPLPSSDPVHRVEPATQVILDRMGLPALVLNARLDVVAFNRLADEVFSLSAARGRFASNSAWRMFMDPERRRLYSDWQTVAERTVGVLRVAQQGHLEDAHFGELISNLRSSSPEFDEMWRKGRTSSLEDLTLRLRNDRFGALSVDFVRLVFAGRPDAFLSILVPADEETERAFRTAQQGW